MTFGLYKEREGNKTVRKGEGSPSVMRETALLCLLGPLQGLGWVQDPSSSQR